MTVSSQTLATLFTSRFCYGPRAGDTTGPTAANLSSWLNGQLAVTADPPNVQALLANVVLTTDYKNAAGNQQVETGALSMLNMTQPALWAQLHSSPKGRRPYEEVCAAHWVRKTWSSAQLRETMSDFWHNHFSIFAFDGPLTIGTWPAYDALIRSQAFGNFRSLLGAVTKSCAMMEFLNLQENVKEHPNENFAREVMELHTLGIAAYFGLTTPAGQAGKGYSDQDVTQAARVLTGWSTQAGTFGFVPQHHDTGTKQLLGFTLSNGGQSEGERLLDFLAKHPATALHISQKLYVRFVSDTIPAESPLINELVSTFLATGSAANQIAQLLLVIANSAEFAQSTGYKFKTPTELSVSWLRAIGSEFSTQRALQLLNPVMTDMGAELYGWLTPDGMPDVASSWISSNGLLSRWNFPETLCAGTTGMALTGGVLTAFPQDPVTRKPSIAGLKNFVTSLATQMVPGIGPDNLAALLAYAQDPTVLGSNSTYSNATKLRQGVGALAAAALALPEFQLR